MGNGFRIGRILGIEIRLDYSWFLVFALVVLLLSTGGPLNDQLPNVPAPHLWGLAFLTALLFFACILTHELSHAYVATLYGIPIINITLFIFGGVARLGEEPRSPGAEFLMTVVGPITSYVLAGFFGLIWLLTSVFVKAHPGTMVFEYLRAPAGWLFAVNAMLATFNLVPGFPLDGGRLLRAGLWHFTGDLRLATRIATLTGQWFGIVLMASGVFVAISTHLTALPSAAWFVFIGWFLTQSARTSYQQVLLRESLRGIAVRDVMSPEVVMIPPDISVAEAVDQYFLRWRLPSFPVRSENGQWREITTEAVRSLPRRQWPFTQVAAVAHPLREDELLSPATDAWDAILRMATRDRPRLLVVEDGQVVGIVTRGSIFQLWETRARLGL